jgi:hypothetical protein
MNIDQCHDPQWGPLYIHNNTFEDNFFRGGRCANSANITWDGNRAHGNGLTSKQPGFRVASSSDIVFKNNVAFDNGINCVIENDHNLTAPDLKSQCPV